MRAAPARWRRWLEAGLLAGLLAAAVFGALRATTSEPATLAGQESAVAASLRCPTCQGLSVAQSPSQIAQGIRLLVNSQLAAGRSPAQVRQFFIHRYGPWILLSPPDRGLAAIIWVLPAGGLAIGAVLAWRVLRRPALAEDGPPGRPPARVSRADQIEAAHRLLGAVQDDLDAGLADERAYQRARDALHAAEALPPDPTEQPASAARRTRAQHPRARRAVTIVGTTSGAAMIAAVLLASVGSRGAGALPTGTLAGLASAPAPASAASGPPPRTAAGWLAAGRAQDGQGQLVGAYRDYQRALHLQPGDPVAELLAASALLRGGSPAQALPLASRAVAAAPGNARAVLVLGLVQLALGHRGAARSEFARFLVLTPHGTTAGVVRRLQARS